ncbi:MAG: hypothetical protein WCK29_03830 [archaeon]
MILNKTPVTIAEVKDYLKDLDGEETKVLQDYIKAYSKVSKADALKMKEELAALNNIKMKEEHIIKIIDLMPKDSEDLAKIFMDVSLTEEEVNSILAIVKNY